MGAETGVDAAGIGLGTSLDAGIGVFWADVVYCGLGWYAAWGGEPCLGGIACDGRIASSVSIGSVCGAIARGVLDCGLSYLRLTMGVGVGGGPMSTPASRRELASIAAFSKSSPRPPSI